MFIISNVVLRKYIYSLNVKKNPMPAESAASFFKINMVNFKIWYLISTKNVFSQNKHQLKVRSEKMWKTFKYSQTCKIFFLITALLKY